jgi:hypothetical protein
MGYWVWQGHQFSLQMKSVEAQNLWVSEDYGLLEVWVRTGLTVLYKFNPGFQVPSIIVLNLQEGQPDNHNTPFIINPNANQPRELE